MTSRKINICIHWENVIHLIQKTKNWLVKSLCYSYILDEIIRFRWSNHYLSIDQLNQIRFWNLNMNYFVFIFHLKKKKKVLRKSEFSFHPIHQSEFFSADFIKLLVKNLVNTGRSKTIVWCVMQWSCTYIGSTKQLRLKGFDHTSNSVLLISIIKKYLILYKNDNSKWRQCKNHIMTDSERVIRLAKRKSSK